MSNKIGLLLPRSVIYPTMSFDMMAGLKNGLAELGISDAQIVTGNVGVGAEPKDVYTACEKLVFDGCMVLVGYVNPLAAEAVQPLLAGAGAILIAMDAGYSYPFVKPNLPNVFTVSLDGVLCCRTMATTAVADGSKRLAFVGSFYEAGYRSIHGFYRGLEDAGGQITFNLVTPLKRAEFTLAPLAEHLEQSEPDGVLASFCGDMLQDFCTAAADGNVFARHPVYGSPFMADEVWLEQCPYPGVDIKVAVTWGRGLENAANAAFTAAMLEKKQRLNIWSMLAWEAARLVAVALVYDADAAIKALECLSYDGVRGTVKMDADTHRACSPVYEGLVVRDLMSGKCALQIVGVSPFIEAQRMALGVDISNFDGMATSWKNAYGCLES